MVEARGLAVADSKRGTSDPYLTVALVDEADNIIDDATTEVVKKTLAPKWNEVRRCADVCDDV